MSIQECIEPCLTYSVPLKARFKNYMLSDPEHGILKTIVQDVYLGTIPYMTPSWYFCDQRWLNALLFLNYHSLPGCIFWDNHFHANGTKLYSARVISFLRVLWIRFCNWYQWRMYASIDKKKKNYPFTTLFRQKPYGFESDKIVLEILTSLRELRFLLRGLKKVLGRKISRQDYLNTCMKECLFDERTGEVVS